jgi:hypothetical protein
MICLELVRSEGRKGGDSLVGLLATLKKRSRNGQTQNICEHARRASLITTTLVATASATRVYWGKNHGNTPWIQLSAIRIAQELVHTEKACGHQQKRQVYIDDWNFLRSHLISALVRWVRQDTQASELCK